MLVKNNELNAQQPTATKNELDAATATCRIHVTIPEGVESLVGGDPRSQQGRLRAGVTPADGHTSGVTPAGVETRIPFCARLCLGRQSNSSVD